MHIEVSSNSQCPRTQPMNVATENAHCDCEKFVQGLGFFKDVWKA